MGKIIEFRRREEKENEPEGVRLYFQCFKALSKSEQYQVEEIDKGYEPCNCHWVTMKEQNRNTRRTHYLTYNGQTKPLTDWADERQIPRATLDARINKLGWSVEKALTTEVKKQNKKQP